ncbi:hypothetical protein HY642_00765 [Candidatus Woesearchaeota archaeon]|nr:hypothetical protein [Candidatus Woesearchaeota archaeon]
MATDYNYRIVGFGKDANEALHDAEQRLPHPVNETKRYERLHIQTPEKVGDKYKVEICYDLQGEQVEKVEAGKVLAKSSSFGPTDPFALTRDLSDMV